MPRRAGIPGSGAGGCLAAVTPAAGRGAIPEADLAERPMLAIYGYGEQGDPRRN